MNEAARQAAARARQVREDEARNRKTRLLIDAAAGARNGAGFTAEEVAGFTDEQWALLEGIAGTRPASATTRALVVAVMRNNERRRREDAGTAVFDKLRGNDPDDRLFDGLGR